MAGGANERTRSPHSPPSFLHPLQRQVRVRLFPHLLPRPPRPRGRGGQESAALPQVLNTIAPASLRAALLHALRLREPHGLLATPTPRPTLAVFALCTAKVAPARQPRREGQEGGGQPPAQAQGREAGRGGNAAVRATPRRRQRCRQRRRWRRGAGAPPDPCLGCGGSRGKRRRQQGEEGVAGKVAAHRQRCLEPAFCCVYASKVFGCLQRASKAEQHQRWRHSVEPHIHMPPPDCCCCWAASVMGTSPPWPAAAPLCCACCCSPPLAAAPPAACWPPCSEVGTACAVSSCCRPPRSSPSSRSRCSAWARYLAIVTMLSCSRQAGVGVGGAGRKLVRARRGTRAAPRQGCERCWRRKAGR